MAWEISPHFLRASITFDRELMTFFLIYSPSLLCLALLNIVAHNLWLVNWFLFNEYLGSENNPMTTKNDQIGFRLPIGLKKELHEIAKREGRTLSQICEIFVYGSLETYKRELSPYIQRLLSQQKKPTR